MATRHPLRALRFLSSKVPRCQARGFGGAVRTGEKKRPVVFWTWYDKKAGSSDAAKDRRFPVLRYYTVFNVAQCDGLTVPASASEAVPFAPIERAESIASSMRDPPHLELGQAAFYVPTLDTVTVPPPGSFRSGGGVLRDPLS